MRDRNRMDNDIKRELEINQLIIKKKEIHNNQLKEQLAKILKMTRFPRLIKQLWKNYSMNKNEDLQIQNSQFIDLTRLDEVLDDL